MSNRIKESGLILVAAVFMAGCGATVNAYMQDKERLDQELSSGNSGYLMGKPVNDEGERRKTRRTYVLEIESKPKEEGVVVEPSTSTVEVPAAYEPEPESSLLEEEPAPVVIRRRNPIREYQPLNESMESASGYTEYTVEEGDTLQKISKKVYGKYSRWQKIYELNQEVIKNPDRIQPGITIKIPQE